jgi:transposase
LDLLLKGAVACGFPNELWTLNRIAEVIQREFGVFYHPNHVLRLLRQQCWSCQVPEWRAMQRDEAAIAHWKRYRWAHIKKGSRTWGPSGLPG